jgi:putative ABC transport system ATP-binding protein
MLIRIRDVCRNYRMGGAEPVHALRGVSLDIDQGEFVALLGKSGSGKSTLMNLIGGLDQPSSGEIEVGGQVLQSLDQTRLSLYRRHTVGFVFQSFNLVPSMRAWENVSLPMVFAGASRAERMARALELLDSVGLGARFDHRPTQLSGGEQQRVAFARSLALKPKLLLGDEPTGNLDSTTSAQIMALIDAENRRGTTVILVTHDPELAAAHARRIVRMADGRVQEDSAHPAPVATVTGATVFSSEAQAP